MAEFTKETLEHLKRLARIDCSLEEEQEVLSSLQKVLSYMEQLASFAEPAAKDVLPESGVRLRPDCIEASFSRDAFLANAPDHVGGMVRIPPVLKEL